MSKKYQNQSTNNIIRGFTLIELLAVIVILAIIALIATPIVLSIINDSKQSATLRTAEFYEKALKLSLSQSNLQNQKIDDGLYNIKDGDICLNKECSEKLEVEVNGEVPKTGNITISSGKITNVKLIFGDKTILKNDKGELVIGELLTDYIKKLYKETKTATVNNIEYSLDTEHFLMNDRLGSNDVGKLKGNIRYYGANPNNYIDIGDRDSEGNIIFWRIIGLFKDIEVTDDEGNVVGKEDLIKIMRADSIGKYSWDNKTNGIGTSLDDRGSNDWSDARLMMLLNPGYDSYNTDNPLKDDKGNIIFGYEGSLYWNSKSGTCYSEKNNVTKDCDFTSIGLSSDTHKKIATVVWNLGAVNFLVNDYMDTISIKEREDVPYQDATTGIERPKNWIGKVALISLSDYGYMSDLSACNQVLYYYGNTTNSSDCTSNNWFFDNSPRTFLNSFSQNGRNVFVTTEIGNVNRVGAYGAHNIHPALYLNADVSVVEEKETTGGLKYLVVE